MSEKSLKLPSSVRSLSARLLVLTIFFVMVAEVLIYAPSIARFRLGYFEERLAASRLATLALEAAPDHVVDPGLEVKLLDHAGAYGITLYRGTQHGELMLSRDMPPAVDQAFDLRQSTFLGLVVDAFATLARRGQYVMRVSAPSVMDPGMLIEVVMDEAPMRRAMYDYSKRILLLSIVISVITAALVFASLQWLLVGPMRRITENMMAFRLSPEDPARVIVPGGRSDEIGVAQQALADMESGLRDSLRERARLAALGSAVTRINHDLRNILATAQLMSDRLATLDDPAVKRLAPPLMAAIDRAVTLCGRTIDFARSDEPIRRERFRLHALVDDVGQSIAAGRTIVWANETADSVEVNGDRDQIFRVLSNLAANAAEAGAKRVTVSASRMDGILSIEVKDDGPGLSPAVRDSLFMPFGKSERPGGTGLGLAIARDITRAHGGDLDLVATSAAGATFRLRLPDTLAGP
ncbi:MAG: HAMP domain-containing sensor histidine kinase [Alphaproteobacteria bacterium]